MSEFEEEAAQREAQMRSEREREMFEYRIRLQERLLEAVLAGTQAIKKGLASIAAAVVVGALIIAGTAVALQFVKAQPVVNMPAAKP